MGDNTKKKYLFSIITLTTLFFMWGFITCLNDILVPYLKDVFVLDHFRSSLVQSAFFLAYFVVSMLYFLTSVFYEDPILKIGYKNTIILGLILSAIGCFLFFLEACSLHPSFGFFLCALFLLGSGFGFLQIAANPLVAILGPASSASSRLNLSQAFNSLGTTLAPIIGGYVIFNLFADDLFVGAERDPSAVQIPYLFLSSVLLLLAGVLFFADIPNVLPSSDSNVQSRIGALKYPHLVFGMLGIFCYVGAEVTIGSNLVGYMREVHGFNDQVASAFLSFYWGGALIGRLSGAISMSQMSKTKKYVWMFVASMASVSTIFLAFSTSLSFNAHEMTIFFNGKHICYFLIAMALNYFMFIVSKSSPSKTLGVFAVVNVVLLLLMLKSEGTLALWTILSVGLFNSIMFSNIFTLAIDGLGRYTSQASSLLVMMILGGAILPPLQGMVVDAMESSRYAFLLPSVCYAYLVWYGFIGCNKRKLV